MFVKIVTESEFFEAKGSVIYSRPNVGFGLASLEVESRFVRVLQVAEISEGENRIGIQCEPD